MSENGPERGKPAAGQVPSRPGRGPSSPRFTIQGGYYTIYISEFKAAIRERGKVKSVSKCMAQKPANLV